ncbi:flagellar basal-body rod protein FlgB [Clostridia bacterium]|nr:flagellar basal-body rod protein FlgB [Clostridia bacterium]
MILENIHNPASILGTALQGLSARNDVIQNNITNADTKNFKKSAVDFETSLREQLSQSYATGELRLDRVKATTRFVNQDFYYRLDGNNVDIDLEMADLYQNGIKYDALTTGITKYYEDITSVLRGIT